MQSEVRADAWRAELPLSFDDLPPRFTRRWPVEYKARLLNAIDAGLLSAEDAIARYALPANALESWRQDRANAVHPAPPSLTAEQQHEVSDQMVRLLTLMRLRGLISPQEAAFIKDPATGSDCCGLEAVLSNHRPVW